jgi:hypothetical protein
MKLKLVRHLWGVDPARNLEERLPRWREVGYSAVEVSIRIWPDGVRIFEPPLSSVWVMG